MPKALYGYLGGLDPGAHRRWELTLELDARVRRIESALRAHQAGAEAKAPQAPRAPVVEEDPPEGDDRTEEDGVDDAANAA